MHHWMIYNNQMDTKTQENLLSSIEQEQEHFKFLYDSSQLPTESFPKEEKFISLWEHIKILFGVNGERDL